MEKANNGIITINIKAIWHISTGNMQYNKESVDLGLRFLFVYEKISALEKSKNRKISALENSENRKISALDLCNS